MLDQNPGIPHRSILGAQDMLRASHGALLLSTRIAGVAGSVRVLATPVHAQDRSLLVIVGTSLQGRAYALANLRALMLLGGPVALVLASLLGYGVSALSLRSVEAMRRQATRLSVTEPGAPVAVPAARDELRRLALTLNEMLDRNEAAFARERRFVADASHELRSPLAVLKAELEDALTGEHSERELRAALVSADAETDRIAHLARDLLTLAQADDGKLPIEPSLIRVREAVERIRQRFAQRARSAGRELVASVPGEMTLHADPLRVEQALSTSSITPCVTARARSFCRLTAAMGPSIFASPTAVPDFPRTSWRRPSSASAAPMWDAPSREQGWVCRSCGASRAPMAARHMSPTELAAGRTRGSPFLNRQAARERAASRRQTGRLER